MWFFPIERNLEPKYTNKHYELSDIDNKLNHIVSGSDVEGTIKVKTDLNMYSGILEDELNLTLSDNRSLLVFCIDGDVNVNDTNFIKGQSVEITSETKAYNILCLR